MAFFESQLQRDQLLILGQSQEGEWIQNQVRAKIEGVADLVLGRKRARNFWGFRLPRQSELLRYGGEGEWGGVFIAGVFIARQGRLVRGLVEEVVAEYSHEYQQVYARVLPMANRTDLYASDIPGLVFQRVIGLGDSSVHSIRWVVMAAR